MQLQAKKSLGQNFLVDQSVHERIVKSIQPKPGETFVEIGPGTGLLTKHLLGSKLQKLIAFELDDRAIPLLEEEFRTEGDRFTIVKQDILQVDLRALSKAPIRIAGNIPYYITSPILFKLIDERSAIKDAHLLVQLEVAERLAAKPRTKAYGIPTVLANFFASVEFLFKVKAGSFRPVPKVDSAVIRVDFENDYFRRTNSSPAPDFSHGDFQRFIRGIFRMRRKTLRNNLKGLVPSEAVEALEGDPVLGQRPEELTIPEFLDLYRKVTPAKS